MSDRPEWFAAKRYGYGTGLPISWQGWLLFAGFLAVVIVAGLLLAPRSVLAYLALVIPLTTGFVLIAKSTTQGGWRWRWGDPD
jgi:hypothetical protein